MAQKSVRKVDHSALRTNQAFIIGVLLAGFISSSWIIIAFVCAVMLIGTVFPSAGLFKLIYSRILRPLGVLKPDAIEDNPEPHLFAQGLGSIFLLGSTIALLLNATTAGWVLTWIVIVLAGVNLFLNFCVGCYVYYQLHRIGISGTVAPLKRS